MSGGGVAYLRGLAPVLSGQFRDSSEGHCVKFVAYREQSPLLQAVPEAQITWVRRSRLTGYRRILWERLNMARIVDEEDTHVLFTPYQVGPPVRGPKHVLMIRNMEPFLCNGYAYSPNSWLRNQVLRWMSVRALRRADRVIAVSEFTRDYLAGVIGVGGHRIRTIYHGRQRCSAHNAEAAEDRGILKQLGVAGNYILTCGSLLPYRRHEDIIAAFEECFAVLAPGTLLVIAGSGTDRAYAKAIRQRIAASPHRDRIIAVGQVPWDAMAALYRHCHFCIFATEVEACPNIAIEAMATGCAIVSSDAPPLPEMFQGCSLQYRSRDIRHLALQMCRYAEDEGLRHEMKSLASKRGDTFSWETCARETYSALVDWKSR